MRADSRIARSLAMVGALALSCNAIIDLDGLEFDRKADAGLGGSSQGGSGASGDASFGGGAGAKPGAALWAHAFTGPGEGPSARGLAVNETGTIVTVGSFEGSVDFRKAPSLIETQGMGDGFVLALDSDGNTSWVKQVFGSSFQKPLGVTPTAGGDWIVTGYFRSEIKIDNQVTSTDGGGDKIALFELDGAGTPTGPIVSYPCTGNSNSQFVAIGKSGAIFLKGVYDGTVDFGTDPMPSATNGNYAGYVAKIAGGKVNSFGFVGVSVITSDTGIPVGGLALDSSENVIIAGGYNVPSMSFGGNPPITNPNVDPDAGKGDSEMYLAKFDSSLNQIWAKTIGAKFNQTLEAVAVDSQDSIVVVGNIVAGNPVQLVPCPPLSGVGHILIAKLDKDGNCLWSNVYGDSTSNEHGSGVAVAPNDDIFLVGNFNSPKLVFGQSPTTVELTNAKAGDASPATQDLFLARFSKQGQIIWARSFGDEKNQYAGRVTLDPNGRPVMNGSFEGSIDFDGELVTADATPDNFDLFVAAFAP